MVPEIQFNKNYIEKSLPIIKVTKSKTGQTGTATFLFITPTFFQHILQSQFFLDNITLSWENKKIQTKHIFISFKKGKPFLLKSIFVFKTNKDWFSFLNFMNHYCKEKGLSFHENNSYF